MPKAKDFNDHTNMGNRKDMCDSAFKIWARTFLKKIIAPEYYILVSANLADMELSYSNRHNFGVIVDGVLEILSEDNEGINIGCRIDDLIKANIPSLLAVRNSGFLNFNRSRVQLPVAAVYSRSKVELSFDEVIVSLGKLSSIRWETLAYIKSGATRGTNFGTLTELCFEQVEKMNEIVASVIGDNPDVLDPGYYSKLLRIVSSFATVFYIRMRIYLSYIYDTQQFIFTAWMEMEPKALVLVDK